MLSSNLCGFNALNFFNLKCKYTKIREESKRTLGEILHLHFYLFIYLFIVFTKKKTNNLFINGDI